VVTVAPRRPRIEFRPDDPTLTANGGLVLVAETCRVLDVVGTIDRRVGPVKGRSRGGGAGELPVGLAECMLAGGDFFCDLDTMRADVVGVVDHYVAASPPERQRELVAVRLTIDLDPTDVEVYGTDKERIGWTYAGVRARRPVPLVWPTPRSPRGRRSRSPRYVTPRCGRRSGRSRGPRGAGRKGCPARRSPPSTTPRPAGRPALAG